MKQCIVPAGMRDLVFEECCKKRQLQKEMEAIFDAWGYQEIITPTIEFFKTYDVGFENIKEEKMYKFFDANGKILMLRADMTIPIARVAATKFKNIEGPLRLRYCANVFKVNEELSGLQNEITDCGVELIKMDEKNSELEILAMAMDALSVIKHKKCILEIGNIKFFEVACNQLRLQPNEKAKLATLIDEKKLKELENYLQTLKIQEKHRFFFKRLPWLNGDPTILDTVKEFAFDEALCTIVDELQSLCKNLQQLGYENIEVDLGKVTNLNYYTGLIFEAYVEGIGKRILSGGRYDHLSAKFGKKMNAIGFSIKLDQLLDVVALQEQGRYFRIEYPTKKQVKALLEARKWRSLGVVNLVINDELDSIKVKEVKRCYQSH